ncbi:MAG: cell division protein FtsK [Rhodospirillaceae bacterium]|jgi:DNA segregation ATPase FtsK/SpoIIIE, S-DNA-T family|nr:cell division protein FtsK [Rhodospirillaceae bacterium]MBT4588273.1 cell division protein FtsK [Rhodospirillaceae bacterium]MBT4938973.1 cell division protein FtsK [Rhodospirillaceae bacterium]MBT7269211.1 cell division protein FtsK [Rhodospirillaceae bacterium]
MARSAVNSSPGSSLGIGSSAAHRTPISTLLTNLFPASFVAIAQRRLVEIIGGGLILFGFTLIVALLSYHHADPSLNSAAEGPARNVLGLVGSYSADIMLQIFGAAAFLPSLVFTAWGWRLLSKKGLRFIWLRLLAMVAGTILGALALSLIAAPEAWPLRTGIGGVAGHALLAQSVALLAPLKFAYSNICVVFLSGLLSAAILVYGGGLDRSEWRAMGQGVIRSGLSIWHGIGFLGRKAQEFKERVEPTFGHQEEGEENTEEAEVLEVPDDAEDLAAATIARSETGLAAKLKSKVAKKAIPVVTEKAKKAPAGKRAKDAGQGNLRLAVSNTYQLPPLDILEAPAVVTKIDKADKDALAQNAELLESVLQDFGVKGEIVKVRPGPVVTLYELEPAPGTKTSRVVGLSDDIARSMSALSVRIAVVPGRSVIGIELPNVKRDIVFFRELLASAAYEKSGASLPLVLGKDIGGAPNVVDLARMPHLLIAGTTGSGKSVAINTMICSLLYRLGPDECKFIMVDPKMLELSVYDGIPNLLAPVVTEPSKAVVALKWAVREMEDRYRLMSQMGVRNITGYNSRLAEARKKGEEMTRRVQTGFDEAGKPVYEEQPLSTDPLPLIVIVVDEMADLMMVAGKDIEALIQRLAQMARAAGLHLIMATQRPSVDVITGTIKANFPTRISFQVTSKIDSRTILGEQGAEQLLGQGDMLYMAGGGQISRIHGPFVSDGEVEQIVNCLKAQGDPTYVDAVTEDIEGGFDIPGVGGGSDNGDELYDEAVAIVAQEGKASTSFIQRRLQIGYNRAARIIEQMEAQEVVSKADRVGRREVLIGAH